MKWPIGWTLTLLLAVVPAVIAGARNAAGASTHPAAAARAAQPSPAPRPNPKSPRPTLALQIGHSGRIGRIAFSPDGKTIATEGADLTIRLWDAATDELKATLAHAGGPLCFSPDGKALATGSGDRSLEGVRLWDAATGELKATLAGAVTGWNSGLAYSPDGKTLLTWSSLHGRPYSPVTTQFWDAATGRRKGAITRQLGTLWPDIDAVAYSPDDKTMVTSTMVSTTRLWRFPDGKLLETLPGDVGGAPAYSPVLSADGRLLEAPRPDGLWLWDTRRQRFTVRLKGAAGAQAFSPDGKMLATGRWLWDTATGKLRTTLQGPWPDQLVFAPDGRTLAAGSRDDTVRIYDTVTGQLKATLTGHTARVTALAFAPDGRTLATTSDDRTARLWDTATGALKATLAGDSERVNALAFSPDGRVLAAGCGEEMRIDRVPAVNAPGRVRLWDVASGQVQSVWQTAAGAVRALLFAPDGSTLLTVSRRLGPGGLGRDHDWYGVSAWDVRGLKASPGGTSSPRLKATLPGYRGRFGNPEIGFVLSSDGKVLATASEEHSLRLRDTANGRLKAVLLDHSSSFGFSVTFSPDGRTLAAAGSTDRVRLWDVETGRLRASLPASTEGAFRLVFSPDGRTLATGGGPRQPIRFWDVATAQPMPIRVPIPDDTGPLAFSPDGKDLATGSGDTVRLWDLSTGQLKGTLRGSLAPLLACAVSPDGKTLATGGEDQTVRLWDLAAGQLRATLTGHTGPVGALAFSPDGRTLASGAGDHTIRLWDSATGRLRLVLPGFRGRVTLLVFSRDGATLAAGGALPGASGHFLAGPPQLWDVATGQPKPALEGPHNTAGQPKPDLQGPGPWVALAFSPDGKILAARSNSEDVTARLWEVETGRLLATLPRYRGAVGALAFSPDGKLLATMSEEPSNPALLLWDVATGQLKTVLPAPWFRAPAVAFSPDGKLLAAGPGPVELWEVATGKLTMEFADHLEDLKQLAFSDDGHILAARDMQGNVLLWNTLTGKPVQTVSEITGTALPPDTRHPSSIAGAAVTLRDPVDHHILATLLPVPQAVEAVAARPHPEEPGAKPIEVGAKPAAASSSSEWFITTPEGYFDCSANAARFIKWNVNGALYPAERFLRRFRGPDLVRQALRGERLTAPAMTLDDVPPTARFVGLKNGDLVSSGPLTVTVEVDSRHDPNEVDLLVNGRPLPPEAARPIEVGAKPIELGAKGEEGAYRIAKRFTFRVPLPQGAPEVHLRAIAYDAAGLGSDPVEVVLKRTGAQPVVGHLFVLAVGVSRYQNALREGFPNLRFPGADARAIAARFAREGEPLYDQVQVRTLTDEQATAANIRAGLQWLQTSVRPGQIDTVVLFLSGHGISQDGHYYFAPADLDLANLPSTSISGRELREALGGKLRAKAVFLFVDTCHAGGLGGRNDDLALEVGDGVYVLASSGSREYSYESPSWGHGAFTLALLRALDQRELASNGVLHFDALTYAVPEEVARLMTAAGRNENEEEPCVPLASRRLRMPLVLAAR